MHKISVIIPVYNTSSFIQDCFCSVKHQTFKDWECILVDDGSTDGSGKICDEWAGRDSRFLAIHQQNSGVSSARNHGLSIAQGKYAAFVDSDDTINPTYLSALYDSMESSSADLAVCGLETICGNGSKTHTVPGSRSVIPLNGTQIPSFLDLERKNLLYGPYVKLYRRQIIDDNHLRFDETKDYGEDLLFNLMYLKCCRSVAMVPEALYRYVRRNGTLSTQFRQDMFEVDYAQWQALMSFHQEQGLYDHRVADYLYNRLWGIIYDSVFAFRRHAGASLPYLRRILSIPEIKQMKQYQQGYPCAAWIKRWILGRKALCFYFYFKVVNHK